MKKLFTLVVALLMIFCLFSCSADLDKTGTDETDKKQQSSEKHETSKNNKKDEDEYTITAIDAFYEGLARFRSSEGKYGYLDVNGDIVIEPTYEDASHFYNGRARVKSEGKYGYLNTDGKMIIHAIYDNADDFSSDLTLVVKEGVKEYINLDGETVYSFTGKESKIGDYVNGYFWIESTKEELSGTVYTLTYFDDKGKQCFQFYNAQNASIYSSFNEHGYAFIADLTKKEYVLIDYQGNTAEFVKGSISSINGNYCWMNGNLCYIDFENKRLLSGEFVEDLNQTITPCLYGSDWTSDIYLCAPRGTWDSLFAHRANTDIANNYYGNMSCVLQENRVVFHLSEFGGKVKGVDCWSYNERLYFPIQMSNSNGTIFYALSDENGELLIQPTTDIVLGYTTTETVSYQRYTYYKFYNFSAGVCKAKDGETGLFGFIDLNGNWVIEPQYKSVTDFSEYGDEAYAVADGLTIIDRKGEVVFTAVQPETEK